MKISKPKWNWHWSLNPIPKEQYTGIALHHMAHPTAGYREVERWHHDRGWNGFGYGYWISFEGEVVEGRGLNQNAGVSNHNSHILSVGFQGDYDKNIGMPGKQLEAGIELVSTLMRMLPNVNIIEGHGYWVPNSCPGRYFPKQEIVNAVNDNHTKEHWAEKYYQELLKVGIDVHDRRFDDPMTRGEVMALFARLIKQGGEMV